MEGYRNHGEQDPWYCPDCGQHVDDCQCHQEQKKQEEPHGA